VIRNLTRILSIIFILFISLFALDVFGKDFSLMALIMNLIPTFIAIILTVIAWKKEFLGGILWILVGIVAILMTKIGLVITLPMMIIGGLNLWVAGANKVKKNKKNSLGEMRTITKGFIARFTTTTKSSFGLRRIRLTIG